MQVDSSPRDDAHVSGFPTMVASRRQRRPTRARLLAWFLLICPVLVALIYPTAQDYLRAASLLARIANPQAKGWLANYDVRPVDIRDSAFEFDGESIPARVYLPRGVASAPGIVVAHGMHELGINEPRLVDFARSLAASGFFVMTPQLPDVADFQLDGDATELIGAAAQSFAQELGASRVGVMSVSFSGGLALRAASDSPYRESIAWVAVLGADYDLAHVLRFYATGGAVRPDGSVERLTPHEYGPLIVMYDSPRDFFAPADVDKGQAAIRSLLEGKDQESEAFTKQMTPSGQEIMQRIYDKQFESFRPAILAMLDKRREQLDAASPAGHLRFLRVPVLLIHGSDDTVIPATELLWLEQHIPEEYLLDALVSPAITHVEVGRKVTLREHFALVRWMALLLRQARNTPPSKLTQVPAGEWVASPA